MRRYETIYVIDPDLPEEKIREEVERFNAFIKERGGEVLTVERQRRKLAYKIRHKTQGEYVRVEYNAPPSLPKMLENAFRVDENVMRFMTTLIKRKENKRR